MLARGARPSPSSCSFPFRLSGIGYLDDSILG
ncbi:hypothetical protein GQ55_3G472800 [Panicum hallii var. hallii]|uniref:Uncharacterized protein n=1 Tax=Panicum hallii var. hallii TaxID=1504633 RepID=A0A2T7EJ99_9POAL|nr:hypothetical protein GQ55_3G472800 [Panicum hallii var. hallii]